ncbi:MAG: glycine cleavage system aminomethyltransferase GcvT [Acidobacteria bacterium]|nr:glycine cleavage system aminomethyltransferase GcvT [Acidobacteriota bacterium]
MSRYSPLHQRHLALNAKLADFGGWDMPIEYPATSGGGVIAEHTAVRERVGIFDVSHLGKAEIVGDGALEFLNDLITNDLTKISDAQAQYTMLCDDKSGGVIDDLIVYRKSANNLFLIPNASNTTAVVAAISAVAPAGISVRNLHGDFGVIAIQGPKAKAVLENLGVKIELEYMAFSEISISGIPTIICRTGYTGEHGYELLPAWKDAEKIWDLLAAGIKKFDGRVCGLGARDTLRTEMGYPLHGHELSLEITPMQANASWAIGWKKPKFWGKTVADNEKLNGAARVLKGLKSLDRGIPRGGMQVKLGNEIVGEITSGTFSPSLRGGIALALLNPKLAIGDTVTIDVRGRESSAVVTKPPFLPSHVK